MSFQSGKTGWAEGPEAGCWGRRVPQSCANAVTSVCLRLGRRCPQTPQGERQPSKPDFCLCHKHHVNRWSWWHKNEFQRDSAQTLTPGHGPAAQIQPDALPPRRLTAFSEETSHQGSPFFSLPSPHSSDHSRQSPSLPGTCPRCKPQGPRGRRLRRVGRGPPQSHGGVRECWR